MGRLAASLCERGQNACVTGSIASQPVPIAATPDEQPIPAWLFPLLICSNCRADQLNVCEHWLECRACGTQHPIQEGVVSLLHPDSIHTLADQRATWRIVEELQGRYNLSLEAVLALPEEPHVRSQFDWFRRLLRERGPCRILELGAGRGWASRILAEDSHQVVATDLLDDGQIGLGCAVRQRRQRSLDYACVLTGAEHVPFRAESFDCVFCIATLRHLADLERVFHEVSRVLRPGGIVVALQEPFRGNLTTQAQKFQDCFTYMLARWWLVGELPATPRPEILHVRRHLGSSIFEICRRVSHCVSLGKAAGLSTTVLPFAAIQGDPSLSPSGEVSPWLDSFAAAFGLDGGRLRGLLQETSRNSLDAWAPQLLAYWLNVGNVDGVLLAEKRQQTTFSGPSALLDDMQQLRQLDPVLLSCATHGFLPIYGVYAAEGGEDHPYFWLQPEAGFLMPTAQTLAMTITCPAPPYCLSPVRFEIRLEAEVQPLYVLAILPGTSASIQLPMPKTARRQQSLLVRLTANFGFVPSDFHPGASHDSRLLSLQIRDLCMR